MRLEVQQSGNQRQRTEKRQVAANLAYTIAVAHGVVRERNDDRVLHQLGRLELAQNGQLNPALRAVVIDTDQRYQNQERDTEDEQRLLKAQIDMIVDPRDDQHGDKADQNIQALSSDKPSAVVKLADGCRIAGRKQRDQTDHQQQYNTDQRTRVQAVRLGRGVLGCGLLFAPHPHGHAA